MQRVKQPAVIIRMMQELGLMLQREHNFRTEFRISRRGVPYFVIWLSGYGDDDRYQVTYFSKTNRFRIFGPDFQKVTDIENRDRDALVEWFLTHRCMCVRNRWNHARMDSNRCPLHDVEFPDAIISG